MICGVVDGAAVANAAVGASAASLNAAAIDISLHYFTIITFNTSYGPGDSSKE